MLSTMFDYCLISYFIQMNELKSEKSDNILRVTQLESVRFRTGTQLCLIIVS